MEPLLLSHTITLHKAQVATTLRAIRESGYTFVVSDTHFSLSRSFAVISGTSDTRHGHRARRGYTTYTEGYYNDIEAAIYKLDPQNSEILPTWINTDGSTHLSTFGMPSEGPHHPLVISQNIGSYNAKYGGYSARVFCVGMNLPVKLALPLDELEREQQ